MHVPTDIQLGPYNGLDAFLVAGPHKLKGRHHVAVVGHSQGRHPHLLRSRHEFPHRTHGLQHAELRMHMEMGERHGRQSFRGGRMGSSVHRRLGFLRGGRLKIRRLKFRGFVHHGFRRREFGPLYDAKAHHLEEAPRRGRDIVRRVVGVAKPFAKELVVKFCQRGPLELAAPSTGDGTKLRAFILGIDDRHGGERTGILPQPQQLGPDHIDVEAHVVSHHVPRLGRRLHEFPNHFIQRHPLCEGALGGDAMNLGRVEWNCESIRLHHHVATRQQLPGFVVQLPRQLNEPRPVVAV